ncbi:hypothetical protein LMG23992_02688 [Cupriavidus laharis]|uniref:Uncharacterized protein n=1 Tax=Cupriavidus laharis TaxID=151654 RepID=A0ABM8X305_9BURK|nr:hypothetical protein LMG23992_02688 [Cupriavidus laharis]
MCKILAVVAIGLLVASQAVGARNTPCSGKKGGVAHCSGVKFVCKDGSISQSKQSCS